MNEFMHPTRSDRTRRAGVTHLVPEIQRSGGAVRPYLGVDTTEYALGWANDQTRAAKAATYHAAYRDLVARWHAANPDSAVAGALDRFYRDGHLAALHRPAELEGRHLVAFRVNGSFVHATESAQRFWAVEAGGHKTSDRTGVCLVCARPGPLLQTIPQQLPARLAPGATKAASLVSFNKP